MAQRKRVYLRAYLDGVGYRPPPPERTQTPAILAYLDGMRGISPLTDPAGPPSAYGSAPPTPSTAVHTPSTSVRGKSPSRGSPAGSFIEGLKSGQPGGVRAAGPSDGFTAGRGTSPNRLPSRSPSRSPGPSPNQFRAATREGDAEAGVGAGLGGDEGGSVPEGLAMDLDQGLEQGLAQQALERQLEEGMVAAVEELLFDCEMWSR